MKIKIIILSLLAFITCSNLVQAQDLDSLVADPYFSVDNLKDEEIDKINVNRKLKINDYTLIGIQYGFGLSRVYWTPDYKQKFNMMPYNFGVTYTRYGKMFGYMSFFGIQLGLLYGQEGYKFDNEVKNDGDAKYYTTYLNSSSAVMNVIEVPVLAHCHIDFWKMKILINAGLYGGYRLSINRLEDTNSYNASGGWKPEYEKSFADFENRFDYGVKGGVGFGFIFDPIEIHLTATYKHSFSTLCKPDYYSKYYYRYAYPMNILVSAGVHIQLTKRTGKSKHEIKREARDFVNNLNKSIDTIPTTTN